ncbi:MAG TPA: glutamine synthetase family protein [Candidatus Dormibacteraeota bacterium]|nr:glutamine synthetase family protein [Candidatus Dormibacteraeota bacterium]
MNPMDLRTAIDPTELESLDVDTVIVAGIDMQGRLFGKRMSPGMFREVGSNGFHICTCVYGWDLAQTLDGLQVDYTGPHTGWHDFRLVPDLPTLRRAAWLDRTAICLADSVDDDGSGLVPIAPRTILRRQEAAVRDAGYLPLTATELEFYLYRGTPDQLRASHFSELTPTTQFHADYNIAEGNAMEPFFQRLRRALEASGIPVEVSQVEYGLGQWEINLRYADAMEMADRHVLFKQAVKDMAAQSGLTATFMPRPMTDDLGSSCHVHASLQSEDGDRPFSDPTRPHGMSAKLTQAIGGLLDHTAELMIWYAPTINAMRRIRTTDFAGNGLTWGLDNRTTSCRVITGSPDTTRVEFRLPGADVNPYLVLSGVLASILDGMRSGADPGPARIGDAYATTGTSPTPLPITLEAAASRFRDSPFANETFGANVVQHYAAVADFEWQQFLGAVTDWERLRYLESI